MSDSLPPGWIKISLGDLLDRLQYGYTASASTTAIGPRFLRITDLRDEGVDWETVPTCVISEADLEKYCLADGDFVFARSGSIEKAWRVRRPPLAVFASYLIRGRPLDRSTAAWLEQFLKSGSYLGQIGAAAAGSGMQNVNAKKLASVSLPLAPLPEQRRVVAKLDALTERSRRAKAALDAIPALIEMFKQSLLAAAFRGDLTADWRAAHPDVEPASELLARIRIERRRRWEEAELAKLTAKGKAPIDDRWKAKYEEPRPVDGSQLAELPRGWAWSTVEEITASHDSRRVPVKHGDRSNRRGMYPYYGAFGIIDHVDDYIFDETLVLLAEDGKNLMERRRPVSLVATGKYWVNNHAHVLEPLGDIPHSYLSEFFNHTDLRERLTGIDQVKLTGAALATLPVAVAPIPEQELIARIIATALSRSRTLHSASDTLIAAMEVLDRSLLAKAFRGELVPQDPSDEPASVLLERIRAERAAADGADGATNGKPGRRRRAAPA